MSEVILVPEIEKGNPRYPRSKEGGWLKIGRYIRIQKIQILTGRKINI